MKLTRDKVEALRRDGYYVESINEPEPVTKPRKKKKTPEVLVEETSAAPPVTKENGPKKWRFDVERDTSGFIVSVNATEIT